MNNGNLQDLKINNQTNTFEASARNYAMGGPKMLAYLFRALLFLTFFAWNFKHIRFG